MFPLTVILNRYPFTPAALPAVIATIGVSDLPVSPLPFSLFRLVGKCACKIKRRYWDLLGYHKFSFQTRNGLTIPGGHHSFAINLSSIVTCWRLETISPCQSGHFGTQDLHGRLYPLPLLLACSRAYASSKLLPADLQDSISGLWFAVTGTGLPPARIAHPQPRPDHRFSRFPVKDLALLTLTKNRN